MSQSNLRKTLPLCDQLVSEAWLDYIADGRAILSVPAFLTWLRRHRRDILTRVNKAAVAKAATQLCGAEAQRRSLRSCLESELDS